MSSGPISRARSLTNDEAKLMVDKMLGFIGYSRSRISQGQKDNTIVCSSLLDVTDEWTLCYYYNIDNFTPYAFLLPPKSAYKFFIMKFIDDIWFNTVATIALYNGADVKPIGEDVIKCLQQSSSLAEFEVNLDLLDDGH